MTEIDTADEELVEESDDDLHLHPEEVGTGCTVTDFRSLAERLVARELRSHGIRFRYEERQAYVLPNGVAAWYTPDFLLDLDATRSDPEPLPAWIEVKPQDFLYHVRDVFNVTRQHGEYFNGTPEVPATAATIWELFDGTTSPTGPVELWKPKMLAELSGKAIWVVGRVGGARSLSLALTPTSIRFSRSNWLVNWPAHEKRQKREQERAHWVEQAEGSRRLYEQRQAERQEALLALIRDAANRENPRTNSYVSQCVGCRQMVPQATGVLHNDGYGWVVICPGCLQAAKARTPT